MANIKNIKTVYGLDWDKEYPQHMIDLICARYGNIPGYWKRTIGVEGTWQTLGMPAPDLCMCRAISALLDPDAFRLNPWTEDIIYGFCNHRETIVLGSSSCTKSETLGVLSPLHWIPDPEHTTVSMLSTDRANLRKRCWSSAVRTFEALKKQGLPGVHNRQLTAILNASDLSPDVSAADIKCGIHGLAVAGSVDTVIGRLIGVHHPQGSYVLITDETQSIHPSIFGTPLDNMMTATEDFRLLSVGNPLHLTDPLCDRGEPEQGWASVTVNDEHWTSVYGGYVIHFNGEKSPGLEHPDEYPFLIRQIDIDRILKNNRGKKNSQGYRTMVQGWFGGGSNSDIIFSAQLQDQYHVKDEVKWFEPPSVRVAGLDPGFGGDDCVLQIADYGLMDNGMYGLAFRDPVYIDIDPDKKLPVQYQIQRHLEKIRKEVCWFPLENLSVDESATQRVSDVIEMESGEKGVLRVSFGTRATERPVSEFDDTPANKKYGNRVTELWATVVEFASHEQIRQLPKAACTEFAIREIKPVSPRRLESKKDLKVRLKRSPDTADAVALCVNSAVEQLNLVPGQSYNNRTGARAGGFRRRGPRKPTVDETGSEFKGSCMDF